MSTSISRHPSRSVRFSHAGPDAAFSPARLIGCLTLCLLAVFMPALAIAGPWQGTETVVDGVPHVQNPAEPAEGSTRVVLEELWRLGGDSDDDEEFFGVIGDIAIGAGGDVYLLDRQLAEIKVYSAEGEYLRTIGREGEGPGEFRNPSGLLLLPGGNIGVAQMMPARIELLTPEGDPAGSFPFPESEGGGMRQLMGAEYRGGSMVLEGAAMQFEEGEVRRTSRLTRVDMEGNEQAEYRQRESKLEMANMTIRETDVFGDQWVLGPDGRLTSADWDYEIQVFDTDGNLDHVITRDFEPYVRSDEERDDVRERMRSRIQIRGPNREPQFEVADVEPAVRWMERADDGSLWVLNAREFKSPREGEIGTYDVFDPDGRFVRQVTLEGVGNPREDRVSMVQDRIFVITQFWSAVAAWTGGSEEESDGDLVPMEVICYRIRGGSQAEAGR